MSFPLVKYFIYLINTPMERGGRREAQTIQNIYTHMKIWMDYCADLSLGYDSVTYEIHLEALRSSLKSRGVSSESFNIYYRSWRSFYEWCDNEGISHLMRFPAKHTLVRQLDTSSRSNSARVSGGRIEVDPGLESVDQISDYKDKILTHREFSVLSDELEKLDPVYKYIAYMMVTTGLRIGGAIQIPLGADALNPGWLRYPELHASGSSFQKLAYIPKGRKGVRRCIVVTDALGVLHNEYVTLVRPKRAVAYQHDNGINSSVPLWLNSKGKEVTRHEIWAAFRAVSELIGRRITPHFLRHTYASYIVYHYFKANGLTPNLAYIHDIHEQLRIQLGHRDIETTKKYIRTVISVKMEAWLPVLTPHVRQLVDKNLPGKVLAAVTNFFEPHGHK
ncbi:tyrosine-type recombinase/integrase [Pseudomonas sp. NPDC090201]|uniref:tyrosine-type recombinase/integrase n=1 Tax=Pseudomonas sp. NPDC090201 TaxID=3364475 RepID=UPI0038218A47